MDNFSHKRRVVIHHTHLLGLKILEHLNKNDLVFFDDCLYSQYLFIKNNIQFFLDKNIKCILGFSSGLYASEDEQNQISDVCSDVLHNECNLNIKTIIDADVFRHSLKAMSGFMKISQIKELLSYDFCYLALHGCCHLNLDKTKRFLDKTIIFKNDLKSGLKQLKHFDLSSDVFVYPYVQSFSISDKILLANNFRYIFGSKLKRYSIEDLISKKNLAKCDN